MRIHHTRDRVVVNVPMSGFDVLGSSDPFVFGFVSEHGSEGDVTDAADGFDRGVERVVDDDATSVVFFDAGGFEIEAFGVGTAANGD